MYVSIKKYFYGFPKLKSLSDSPSGGEKSVEGTPNTNLHCVCIMRMYIIIIKRSQDKQFLNVQKSRIAKP